MKKKIIAGVGIISILACSMLGIGVLATSEGQEIEVAEADMIEVAPENEAVTDMVDETVEEIDVTDMAEYYQNEYSAFCITVGTYYFYFDSMQGVFDYLASATDRTENTVSVISDIMLDRDYTMPSTAIPITFVSSGSHYVDLNSYHLYDASGNVNDFTNSGLEVIDNTNVGTPEVESLEPVDETIPETASADIQVVPDEPEKTVYVYRYVDVNGNIISEQHVNSIEELQAPEIPQIDGLSCLGWSEPSDEGDNVYVIAPLYFKLG